MDFDLVSHTHLLMVAGSRAYGVARPDSDVDLKGVAIPPAACLLGLQNTFDQADQNEQIAAYSPLLRPDEAAAADAYGLEGSVFGLHKFVRLAIDCNPHVIDALFCRDDDLRICTPLGSRLRAQRHLFLSRRARHSFGTYARSQLKRIRGHRRWLLEPPTEQPVRSDYDLPESTLIPREQLQAAEAAIRKQLDQWQLDLDGLSRAQQTALRERITKSLGEISAHSDARHRAAGRAIGMDDNLIEVMRRERQYRTAMQGYRAFKRWERERNPARAALEASHGYDTKHASHLVRLLRMALEILERGEVRVWRGDLDADELVAIRDGAWSYDQLSDWADDAEAKLAALESDAPLPLTPDTDAIDALVVELVSEALGLRG